jgi:glycosyltransferase involved in cell wall biosynthesis
LAILYKLIQPQTQVIPWVGLSEHTEKNLGMLRRTLRKFLLKKVDTAICSGQSAGRYLKSINPKLVIKSFYPDPELQYLTLQNDVEPQTPKQLNFLFVGNSSKRKNLDWLVTALKEWTESIDCAATLSVAGVPTNWNPSCSTGLLRVNNLGFLSTEELIEAYKSSAVVVAPTLADEWGMFATESISLGCPVIGSIYSQAVNELIEDDVNGWRFDPHKKESLFYALNIYFKIHQNSDEVKSLRINTLATFKEKHRDRPSEVFLSAINESFVRKSCTNKIVIITPYINTYREAFYFALQEKLTCEGISLEVLTGKPFGIQSGSNDLGTRFPSKRLYRFGYSFKGKILRFRIPTRSSLFCDLLVVEHATGNLETYFLLLLRKALGLKTAVWGHGYTITQKVSKFEMRLQRFMILISDYYLAYTEGSAERALSIGAKADKVFVLNNSIDTYNLIDLSRLDSGEPQFAEGWNALFLGSLTEGKEIEDLVILVDQIRSQHSDFRLIVGGEGPGKRFFTDHFRDSYVTHLGYLDDREKVRVSKECKVILSTGRIGLLAVDSFALGLPIVHRKYDFHGPEFEYLNTHNSFPVENDEQFVSRIGSLMENPQELSKVSDVCRKMSTTYSIENFVENFSRPLIEALKS